MTFLADNAALLLSGLALWASWRANSIANSARAESGRIKLLEMQGEVLREIGFQHAKFGSLLAATDEAVLIYTQTPELRGAGPRGYERVRQNIEAVQSLRSRYEEQRKLAEDNVGNGSIKAETQILANIRRLTTHVQEDLDKELRNVESLRQQAHAPNKALKRTVPPPADLPLSLGVRGEKTDGRNCKVRV